MSLETVIPFVVQHNSAIIQAIVAAILFLVAILAIRNFRAGGRADANAHAGGLDIANLEATLKKLLDKAQTVPQGTGTADQSLLASEIETLRSSLQEKQDQIEQLKLQPVAPGAESASGAAALSDGDKSALEAQVRDLQAKLSEYEIISEDIADLSFYKDENSKLTKQLESMKTGGADAVTPTAAAPAAPVPTPVAAPAAAAPAEPLVTEEALAEALAPLTKDVPVEAVVPPTPPARSASVIAVEAPAKLEVPEDPAQGMVDALMATPEADLQAQAAATLKASMDAAAEASNATADDDLMKDLNAAVTAQGGKPILDESVAASLFDVDRMTAEATHLQEVAVTAKEVSAEDLAAGLDAERLALEAANMEIIKPEDAKLMGDFEDFMKKGGGQ